MKTGFAIAADHNNNNDDEDRQIKSVSSFVIIITYIKISILCSPLSLLDGKKRELNCDLWTELMYALVISLVNCFQQ